MSKYQRIIKKARNYLESLDKKVETLEEQDDKFNEIMKEFYDFFHNLHDTRNKNIEKFELPDDIELLIQNIHNKFQSKIFKDNYNLWLEHIQDSISRLIHVCNNISDTLSQSERRIVQISLEIHYINLVKNIDTCNSLCDKKIPSKVIRNVEIFIKNFTKKHNMYIRTKEDMELGKVEFETIGWDEILDLYEKSKTASEKEKQLINKKIKRWTELLESRSI